MHGKIFQMLVDHQPKDQPQPTDAHPIHQQRVSADAIEEERRLFYVAATRAKDQLYLTYPGYWMNASPDNRIQRASRFLKEIPIELVEEWWIGAR